LNSCSIQLYDSRPVCGGRTDWPHPNAPFIPNDGGLMDLVPLYSSDEALRRRLLVDKPARLFKFRS
jgi:hypothetical protein